MDLRQLAHADFSDKVGHEFCIDQPGVPAIPLRLAEAETANARNVPNGMRSPFSLIFRASDPRVLPQRSYRLQHRTFGALDVFLVPIGKDAGGVIYQATFN
jgi:hypothetical protein